MSSPCLTCPIHKSGLSKELEPACQDCDSSRAYADQFEPMVCNVPLELTSFGRCLNNRPKIPGPDPDVIMEWQRAFREVKKICRRHGVKPTDLQEVELITPLIRATRREIVKTLTGMDVARNRIAAFCGIEDAWVFNIQVRLGLRKPMHRRKWVLEGYKPDLAPREA